MKALEGRRDGSTLAHSDRLQNCWTELQRCTSEIATFIWYLCCAMWWLLYYAIYALPYTSLPCAKICFEVLLLRPPSWERYCDHHRLSVCLSVCPSVCRISQEIIDGTTDLDQILRQGRRWTKKECLALWNWYDYGPGSFFFNFSTMRDRTFLSVYIKDISKIVDESSRNC